MRSHATVKFNPVLVTRSVFIAVCIFIIWSLLQNLTSLTQLGERLSVAEERTNILKQQKNALQVKLEDSKQPYAEEKLIRNQLGLYKTNEVVLIIPENKLDEFTATSNSADIAMSHIDNDPILLQWLNLFWYQGWDSNPQP